MKQNRGFLLLNFQSLSKAYFNQEGYMRQVKDGTIFNNNCLSYQVKLHHIRLRPFFVNNITNVKPFK